MNVKPILITAGEVIQVAMEEVTAALLAITLAGPGGSSSLSQTQQSLSSALNAGKDLKRQICNGDDYLSLAVANTCLKAG